MKRLLFLLPLAAAAFAQAQGTPYDCQATFTLTSATTTAPINNLGAAACVSWRLTYYAEGATNVSLTLEGAPDSAGTPGTFAAVPNSQCSSAVQPPCLLDGANPLTDPGNATLAARAYYGWLRVNVGTMDGTQIRIRLYGYKGTSAAAFASTTPTVGIPNVNSLPATCTPGSAATGLVTLNGTPLKLCTCTATDTYECAFQGAPAAPSTLFSAAGETLAGDTSGLAAIVPGNITTATKCYVQAGNGTLSALPSWQPCPTSGALTYYFTATASDIITVSPTTLQATAATYTPKTTLGPYAMINGTANIQNFATNAGNPGLTFIPAGVYVIHLHYSRSVAPISSITLKAVINEVTSTGTFIATIGTTESTPIINPQGGEQEADIVFADSNVYTLATAASRIQVVIQAVCTSTTPTVNLFVGQTADAHISLPANAVDVTSFVPYTGAANDLDLGPHKLITPGLPTDCTGQPTGTLWNNLTIVNVCP